MQYHIPCQHETGAVPDAQQVSDYHPLTREAIADLLIAAQEQRDDVQIVSSIQVRLCQGIVGFECPHLIEGPIAEAQYRISKLYMQWYEQGADPGLVEELYALMHL